MKFINQHPIHENDSHLSTATIINKKADKTIIDQEENHELQSLSSATEIENNTTSTVTQYEMPDLGNKSQKISHDTEIENNSKPQVGGSNGVNDDDVEHVSNATKMKVSAQSTYKMQSRPEQGDKFQHLQSYTSFK